MGQVHGELPATVINVLIRSRCQSEVRAIVASVRFVVVVWPRTYGAIERGLMARPSGSGNRPWTALSTKASKQIMLDLSASLGARDVHHKAVVANSKCMLFFLLCALVF